MEAPATGAVNAPHGSQRKVAIEGVTRWMRSESSDCICCEGPHIFCYTVDLDPWPSHVAAFQDSASWVHEAIRTMPEGARVRMTVEVVADGN